ncbi:MAG: type II secretion system protein GspM [Gammaproteobacteria bacterium]
MPATLHRLAALLLLLAALAASYGLFNRFWIGKHRFYAQNIEQLQDRLQRAGALLASKPELEAQIQSIRQDSSAAVNFLQQSSPTLAATDLQQRAKTVIEGKGGSLLSTQILPVANEGAFTRVGIRVQMNSDVEALQKVLYELESAQPLLFIDNVQLRARTIRERVRPAAAANANQRGANPPQVKTQVQLTSQFELAGYIRAGGT